MEDNYDWLVHNKTWKKWTRIGDGESLSYAGIDFHKPIGKEQLMGPRGAPTTCLNQQGALFFRSDLSWSVELIPMWFLRVLAFWAWWHRAPVISNIGIKTELNSFRDFPYVTTFSLRSISVFYLWKTEQFWKELSPSEIVIFGPRNFGKRSFSEIVDQCNFGKNWVWRKFSDSLRV